MDDIIHDLNTGKITFNDLNTEQALEIKGNYKKCVVCGLWFPRNRKYFVYSKKGRNHCGSYCRDCFRIKMRKYQQNRRKKELIERDRRLKYWLTANHVVGREMAKCVGRAGPRSKTQKMLVEMFDENILPIDIPVGFPI